MHLYIFIIHLHSEIDSHLFMLDVIEDVSVVVEYKIEFQFNDSHIQ